MRIGNQTSAPGGVSTARGATPSTVVPIPAKRIAWPTTAGSPPYRSCHIRYDTTTPVGGVFGAGDSLGKPPSVIGNPNTSKNPSLTAYAVVFNGAPSLRRRVTSFGCTPATWTIDRLG